MIRWNIGVYLRLSSDDGTGNESNSISNQRKLIENYIGNIKNSQIYDYYIDDGYSGTSFDRPSFKRMIKDIIKKNVNCVIVKDLSRFGRNYIETGNYLENFFPTYNIRFIAINDNIDSFADPNSSLDLIVPIKNLMNDEYARDISKKVKSVLKIKQERGEFVGSLTPYGYLKDPKDKHKIVVDHKVAPIVKFIFAEILKGKSKHNIIMNLNEKRILTPSAYRNTLKKSNRNISEKWTMKSINRIIKNPTYCGDLVQSRYCTVSYRNHKEIENDSNNYIIVRNNHTPLIERNIWEKVQKIAFNKSIKANKEGSYSLFAGILKCKTCGGNFTKKFFEIDKYKYTTYNCDNYIRKGNCSSHLIHEDELYNIILKTLNTHLGLLISIVENLDIKKYIKKSTLNSFSELRIDNINEEIERNKKFLNGLEEDLNNGYLSNKEFNEYKHEYENLISSLTNEKSKIINESLEDEKQRFINTINEIKEIYPLKKLDRSLLVIFLKDIMIDNDKSITINFNFMNEYKEAIDLLLT